MIARTIAAATLGSGVAGWAIENLWSCQKEGRACRYSRVFGETHVPFLPVYAAGGAAVAAIAPRIAEWNVLARGLVYGTALSGIEYAAGALDRGSGWRSWDYGRGRRVDLPHAAAWAVLGLGLEQILRSADPGAFTKPDPALAAIRLGSAR